MHPVSVEYLFEGDKANLLTFEGRRRVDFREHVRMLAAHFRVRIDMRQIGVRDRPPWWASLGHCGQELCCKRLGGRSAPCPSAWRREQDLSLNPQRYRAWCGRLMAVCATSSSVQGLQEPGSQAERHGGRDAPTGGEGGRISDVPRRNRVAEVMGEKPVESAAGRLRPARGRLEPPEPRRRGGVAGRDDGPTHRICGRVSAVRHTTQLTGRTQSWPIRVPCAARAAAAEAVEGRRLETAAARAAVRRADGKTAAEGRQAGRRAGAERARKPRRWRSTKVGGEGAAAPRRPRLRSEAKAAGRRSPDGRAERPAAEAPVRPGRSGRQRRRHEAAGASAREARALRSRGPKGMQPSKRVPARSPRGLAPGPEAAQPRQDNGARPRGSSGTPSGEGGRPTGDGGLAAPVRRKPQARAALDGAGRARSGRRGRPSGE